VDVKFSHTGGRRMTEGKWKHSPEKKYLDLSDWKLRDDAENYTKSFKGKKFMKNEIGGSCSAEISTYSMLKKLEGVKSLRKPKYRW
jgi:hypothetical protein